VSSETRKYELKQRAEQQGETRRRIVEATAALHFELGPAKTTISEIARRAGVQRATIYNHFSDEEALISACSENALQELPPPDFGPALAMSTPAARLRAVLTLMYEWFHRVAPVYYPVLKDRGAVPALDRVLQRVVDAPQAELAASLVAGFDLVGELEIRVSALIVLSLDFWTWHRLSGEGLSDPACADLMTGVIAALVATQDKDIR
jgi:AcrR family transcriptional regulator